MVLGQSVHKHIMRCPIILSLWLAFPSLPRWSLCGCAKRLLGTGMDPTLICLPLAPIEMGGAGWRQEKFYQASTGHIVNKYNEALEEQGFRPCAGVDASSQPPDDVLLHETVAAWLRIFLRKRPFKKPGNMVAQRKDFVATLADFVAEANEKNDVSSLCESFPARLQKLVKKKGDRLGS